MTSGSDLFFYNQWEFRKIPKRFRKLPEDLPESLRFAHLNPKVAALLANKERIHKQEKEDPFGDGLGQKSLIPDINTAFQNVRNQFDSALSNDEDSQRYLFEEAKFSAQGILEQLSRIIYFYEELHKHIPKSLEYQLMSGYKELTADVTIIPREWQTHEMKIQYATSLQHEGTSDMEEFDDMSSRPRSRLDSSGRTLSEVGSRMNLKKRGPKLGVIEASPDEDRLGVDSRVGGRKLSVSRTSMVSQQQKLHPDANSRMGSRVRKGSSVSSHRSATQLHRSPSGIDKRKSATNLSPSGIDRRKSGTSLKTTAKNKLQAASSKIKIANALSATNLDRRPSATKLKRSPIPLKGGAAKQKLKSAFSKVKCAAVLSNMSPSVYKGRRDDQFSMIDETPSDLRSTALALPSSYMQTINFQLSNPSFEEKGWIMLKGLQEEVDPNAVLEYCVTKLQESMKQTAAIRQKEIEQGYDKPVIVRYYGDTRKETILKFRRSPVKNNQNTIQKGGKPNIPSITDERNEGKKLMEVSHTDGTTVIYYPSGRPAIIYSAAGFGRPGYFTIVYNDGLDSKVLACFTPSGKGVCYHPNGVVRFLSTEKGGHISEENGSLGRKWKWPQANVKITEPISFQLNPHLMFHCIGRGQMKIVFNCHKESARFSVSPSPGVEEYKIGEDTEQLLTAFTFSSKTAKDLMRIFAPKKQKKAKPRKKLKPLIVGLKGKLLKDVTAEDQETNKKGKRGKKSTGKWNTKSPRETTESAGDMESPTDEKSTSEVTDEKSTGEAAESKDRKMSPYKQILLDVSAISRMKKQVKESKESKMDIDEEAEAKPEPSDKIKTGKSSPRPEKSKETEKTETKASDNETQTRPKSAKKSIEKEETEEGRVDKVKRPRLARSKEREKSECKIQTEEKGKSKEIGIAQSEKQEKIKRPRSARSKEREKSESKIETEEKGKSKETGIAESEKRGKLKRPKSARSKEREKSESKIETEEKGKSKETGIAESEKQEKSKRPKSTRKGKKGRKSEKDEVELDENITKAGSSKRLSTEDEKSEKEENVSSKSDIEKAATDKTTDREDKLEMPSSSKGLSAEAKSEIEIEGILLIPSASKRLSTEDKTESRLQDKLSRPLSARGLGVVAKASARLLAKLSRPLSAARVSTDDTKIDAKLARPSSSKSLRDKSEEQSVRPTSSKAESKDLEKSKTLDTISPARPDGIETKGGSPKVVEKDPEKSVSRTEKGKRITKDSPSPRSKGKKTAGMKSKTELVAKDKSSTKLSKKLSTTKSMTVTKAQSTEQLDAFDEKAEKKGNIDMAKPPQIEIQIDLVEEGVTGSEETAKLDTPLQETEDKDTTKLDTEDKETEDKDTTKLETALPKEEISNVQPAPFKWRRGAVQYVSTVDSKEELGTEEVEEEECVLEEEKRRRSVETDIKSLGTGHSRASLSAKETRNHLSVKEGRSTSSARELRSGTPTVEKAATLGLTKGLEDKEKGSSGEGRLHDIKVGPAKELKTEQKVVAYAEEAVRKSALKEGEGKGEKKKDGDKSDHTSKSQASDIVKLLSDFPDKVTYELEADKEHARLQRKARNLIDDWMEHYRIALGLSSPALEAMSDSPPYSIATRQAKSAKQSEAGLMIRRAVLGVDDDEGDGKKARVPSAPLAGRVAGVNMSSSPLVPSQFIKLRTPTPSLPPTPMPRLCLSGLSGEKLDDLDDDLLDIPLDSANKRDSMVTFEEPGHAGGDTGLVPSAAAMINRMVDTASRRSARSKASSARSLSPSRQSVFTSMSERVPSALSGARSHCPLVIRQQILGYERPQCRCSRHHIPFITDVELDEYVSTEVPEGQLIIVMVVSSLFPGITKAEEMLNEIYQNQNRNRTRPCVQSRSDMFRVFKYDINTAAEMSDHTQPLLLTRHNVVPGMFLMYCDGKLLFCDHIFNGYGSARKDFKKQVMKSRYDAIQGYNLPKDFKFSPSRGKSGMRSAWGGEIGGAGVDKYSSPGTILDSSLTPIHRPLSSSSGNSKEIQIEAVSSEFVDLGPFHKEITVRLKPLVTYRVPKQRLGEAASLLVTSLSTTGLQRVSLRPLALPRHVTESTA